MNSMDLWSMFDVWSEHETSFQNKFRDKLKFWVVSQNYTNLNLSNDPVVKVGVIFCSCKYIYDPRKRSCYKCHLLH